MRRFSALLAALALAACTPVSAAPNLEPRVAALEAKVTNLTARVAALEAAHASPAPTPTPTPTSVPTPTPGGFPPDTTLRLVTPPPIPPLPGYLVPVTDPTWGTKITRISNVPGQRNAYSRTPAWNSDQTKLLLAYGYPGRMLNGTTYADLGAFSQISQAVWANTDPNALYGREFNGSRLYRQNASTGALTSLHSFTGYTISIGDGEGGIDDTDTYIALIATLPSGVKHLITYNIRTDTVLGDIVAPPAIDWCQVSRKGNYVVTGGTTTRRYTMDLSSSIELYPYDNHGDNALDASGNEVFVANSSPEVNAFRLSDGARTQLLVNPSALGWSHTSGRNFNRPGWAYLSVYDDTQNLPGRDQLVAVKTDGSRTVEVFGFTNSRGANYAAEPMGVPSPDGKRFLFGSNWGATNVYAFVAEAP